MRPRAFLFDFDGVIVDSISLHLRAWDKAVQEVFGQTLSTAIKESLIGHSTQTIAARLTVDFGLPGKAQLLADTKRRFLRWFDDEAPLLPGVEAIFSALAERRIPFGIASNAPRSFIAHTLEYFKLAVPVLIGIEDLRQPKPSPEAYLVCAQRLGLPLDAHRETVVFEDSRHGLAAACAAGMVAVGVTTHHTAEELRAAGAAHTCLSLEEAMNKGWLDEMGAPTVSV